MALLNMTIFVIILMISRMHYSANILQAMLGDIGVISTFRVGLIGSLSMKSQKMLMLAVLLVYFLVSSQVKKLKKDLSGISICHLEIPIMQIVSIGKVGG